MESTSILFPFTYRLPFSTGLQSLVESKWAYKCCSSSHVAIPSLRHCDLFHITVTTLPICFAFPLLLPFADLFVNLSLFSFLYPILFIPMNPFIEQIHSQHNSIPSFHPIPLVYRAHGFNTDGRRFLPCAWSRGGWGPCHCILLFPSLTVRFSTRRILWTLPTSIPWHTSTIKSLFPVSVTP